MFDVDSPAISADKLKKLRRKAKKVQCQIDSEEKRYKGYLILFFIGILATIIWRVSFIKNHYPEIQSLPLYAIFLVLVVLLVFCPFIVLLFEQAEKRVRDEGGIPWSVAGLSSLTTKKDLDSVVSLSQQYEVINQYREAVIAQGRDLTGADLAAMQKKADEIERSEEEQQAAALLETLNHSDLLVPAMDK